MAKLTILSIVLLFLLHWLTPNMCFPSEPSSTSTMSQFLEQRPTVNEDEPSWTHLLPSNYYSELNQQYYVRFRRQSALQIKDLRRTRPYAFEYARYL